MAGTGFFWILVAGAGYGVFHSILASRRVKAWAARLVGPAAYQRYYRLFFVGMALLTVLPVLILIPLLPDQTIYAIPAPWVFLTLALQAVAVVALLVGVMQTGAMNFLGIQQLFIPAHSTPATNKLVVHGLYRWVRHPLYTASFVLLWLTPVMTWNVLALNLSFSAYLLIGTIFEEQKLVDQFGEAYRAYRRKTPRILPGLKR